LQEPELQYLPPPQEVPSSAFEKLDVEVAGLQIWQLLAGLAAPLA
jgi:hypothetical protein